MKLDVLDIDGKLVGDLETTFNFDVKLENPEHLNYLTDKYQKAYLREGNASSKSRGEVSGGGAKPYKQKGTGRARRGTNRTPLRRGGSVIFGPKPRSFKIGLNQKVFNQTYRHVFSERKNDVVVLKSDLELSKTKVVKLFLSNLVEKESAKIVFILNDDDYSLFLSARNIPNVSICGNAFVPLDELYRADKIIFTEQSFHLFEEVHLR